MAFDKSEYLERIQKTKQRMLHEGIEVLLVTDPANMNYLSGYDGWSFYVEQMVVLIIDEDQPFWIGRGMDANGAKATTWLYKENIISYTDDYVDSKEKHPMQFVASILKQMGQGNRVFGVEKGAYYFTALTFEYLQHSLPNAQFKDATSLVNQVRIVKSEQEIAYIKNASRIVELGMNQAIQSIAEGVRECDVVGDIYKSLISGTSEFGGDYPAIVPMLPSGEHTSTPHLTWSDKRYQDNDLVIIELAGCYKRYHSPMARTVSIGPQDEKVNDLSKVVVEGLNAALDVAKPGVTCEEVEDVWRKTIARHGITKDSRIGYSTGLSYPPDWGEHTASLRQGDKTVLEPNMVFHMIPGIWYDDYGIEISESFRVTNQGSEVLADMPRKLIPTSDYYAFGNDAI
ncbi:M24 family metallopeptidase [Pontibacillus yanchengensis]|uniref:M24 family metallopeptidase n=1 Tax=Pontibacillus yanchengensis TaxID=462910 RepID=A0A6I5A0Q2_9BACI|nr:M24 family metallopeptidase [Pontibacillus yanchengensis]MYL34946.1 M24 family metallopeptidase [Pontibacillus yanchengensis]